MEYIYFNNEMIMHPTSNKIKLPLSEIEFTYVRSSGAGGQNVNKVSSKAVLRWNAVSSTNIPYDILSRFLARFQSRLTKTGDIIITSEKHRDQIRNQADCLNKLYLMLISVESAPTPRIKTKISYAKKEKGLEKKRTHGLKKRLRQKPKNDE